MIFPTRASFIIAVLLDLALGDPRWLPHPVRGMGLLIQKLEPVLRRIRPLRLAGCALVVLVVGASIAVTWLTLWVAGSAATIFWVFSCLAVRSLDREASRVVAALRSGDTAQARSLVGMIVGRDTKALTGQEITRAVFETVAESTSDGIIAPLFYLALGGVPGMVAYKAINTLDSMVGYKNEKYRQFGWASARLDDVVNYIPARITAALIVVAAAALRLHWRNAIRTVIRDADLQPSPNAGYPEAAFAGALGVRLGGLNHYGGKAVRKPFLGDPKRELHWKDFSAVRMLMYASTFAMFAGVTLWLW
jgi:adenosylcobinamide-phosphate synthase